MMMSDEMNNDPSCEGDSLFPEFDLLTEEIFCNDADMNEYQLDISGLLDQNFSSDIPTIPKEWMVLDQKTNRHRPPRLYEFLILLLLKPEYRSYASFRPESSAVFEIHQPEKVAQLWEQVKNRQANNKMTYDKFARAIRWYYTNNIMVKTNARYTFQFSPELLKGVTVDENNNITITTPTPIVK